MEKKGCLILLLSMLSSVLKAATVYVFVSFSLPELLLQETLQEAAHLKLPVYINGLYKNSMPETALKIMKLAEKIPDLSLQIDPTAFERFAIKQVPALVVEKSGAFDVIYGHLPLEQGLQRIVDTGDSGFTQEDLRGLSSD